MDSVRRMKGHTNNFIELRCTEAAERRRCRSAITRGEKSEPNNGLFPSVGRLTRRLKLCSGD